MGNSNLQDNRKDNYKEINPWGIIPLELISYHWFIVYLFGKNCGIIPPSTLLMWEVFNI